MSVQTLITNYEKHLEANWTREGERIIDGWVQWTLKDEGYSYGLTAENIEEIYSKPLPSRTLDVECKVSDETLAKWRTTTLHIGQDFHHESIPTAGAKKTLS